MRNEIEPNSYFDSNYYDKSNDPVKRAIHMGVLQSPLEHFCKYGDAEQRQPSAVVNLKEIYQNNAEVAQLVDQNVTSGVIEALVTLNKVCGYKSYSPILESA